DEQPLTDSYASFREPETSAMSHQQLIPESPTDPKADDLAQNCRDDSSGDQRPDIEVVGSGGEKSGRDQSRLGRQRNPHAFKRDECCNQPDAADSYELSQFRISPGPRHAPAVAILSPPSL